MLVTYNTLAPSDRKTKEAKTVRAIGLPVAVSVNRPAMQAPVQDTDDQQPAWKMGRVMKVKKKTKKRRKRRKKKKTTKKRERKKKTKRLRNEYPGLALRVTSIVQPRRLDGGFVEYSCSPEA